MTKEIMQINQSLFLLLNRKMPTKQSKRKDYLKLKKYSI